MALRYFFSKAVFYMLFVKFYSSYSTKWMFLIAVSLSEIGNLVCGTASSSTVLIIGRAIDGLGAAGILFGVYTLIGYSVPLRKRSTYFTLAGVVYGLSSVIRPIIAGALTDKVTWRWVFYINLPIGGAVIIGTIAFYDLPNHSTVTKLTVSTGREIAYILGVLSFAIAILSILLALKLGWDKIRVV